MPQRTDKKARLNQRRGEQFAIFYAAYPRKKAPRTAERAFNAALKRAPFEQIMAGLAVCKFSPDPTYIPYPATWLNGDCWVPEVITAPPRLQAPAETHTSWRDGYDADSAIVAWVDTALPADVGPSEQPELQLWSVRVTTITGPTIEGTFTELKESENG